VAAVDSKGRTIWITDAHRAGKPFVVGAEEKLTVFLELEAAVRNRQEYIPQTATEKHERDNHRKSA
jgi:hypothetical protein